MISETVLLWLGTMALLVNYAGIAKADNDASAGIAYGFALVLWLSFTMNALGYSVYSGGSSFTAASESVWLIGIVATIITLVLLISVAFDGVKDAFQRQA